MCLYFTTYLTHSIWFKFSCEFFFLVGFSSLLSKASSDSSKPSIVCVATKPRLHELSSVHIIASNFFSMMLDLITKLCELMHWLLLSLLLVFIRNITVALHLYFGPYHESDSFCDSLDPFLVHSKSKKKKVLGFIFLFCFFVHF